jgi:hypothetical protein
VPQIAVLLDREQAYQASCTITTALYGECQSLMEHVDHAPTGGVESVDAQATGIRLRRMLAALDAIGWPHHHAWPGCQFTMPLDEQDRSPWGGNTALYQRPREQEQGR